MTRPPRKALNVADEIASRIAAGEEGYAGEWLPSERKLSETFDSDRGTVRRALGILADRRIVDQVPGAGAKIRRAAMTRRATNDLVTGSGPFRGIGATIHRRGGTPRIQIINVGEVTASSQVAYLLNIPVGTTVLERHRVHSSDENGRTVPIQISTAWLPLAVVGQVPILRELDTGPGGMIQRLEDAGYELRYEDVISCRPPDVDEQRMLDIGELQPVLDVWRRTFDQRGDVIEAGRRVINPLLHELAYDYPHT